MANNISVPTLGGDRAMATKEIDGIHYPIHRNQKNELGYDAWGRQKSVEDRSIFHGMFTFNVPVSTWYEVINGTTQTSFANATSEYGALKLVAGGALNDKTKLRSFRNPRYEPNRGHLYSTAGWFPIPTANQNRMWGIGTDENGVFFKLDSSGDLYGVLRTTDGGGTTERTVLLDTTGIDLSKGNVFDIQFQWRGVGNYKFFVNLQEVGIFNNLGTLTALSLADPALPAFFENENLGDNNPMYFGCIDVTSEGGKDNGKTYGSLSITTQSGQVAIDGYNIPIIAVRSKLNVGGKINTRDTLALLASAYSDNKGFLRVWATRDFTAITEVDQSWQDYGDGHLEFIEYDNPDVVNPMTFDTTKASLVFGCRVGQDITYATSAIFEGRTGIYQTPGDMFVFTMHRENGGALNCGVSYEFAEAI